MSRIYQWSTYPAPIDPTQKTLEFQEDKDGGCVVACGNCQFIFNEKGLESCPSCGYDLIFPRCDW